jgi:hypothetical protein
VVEEDLEEDPSSSYETDTDEEEEYETDTEGKEEEEESSEYETDTSHERETADLGASKPRSRSVNSFQPMRPQGMRNVKRALDDERSDSISDQRKGHDGRGQQRPRSSGRSSGRRNSARRLSQEEQRRGPRKPFTDVPKKIDFDKRTIHPINEETGYSAEGDGLGNWDLGEPTIEEEIVFEDATKKKGPMGRLFGLFSKDDAKESRDERIHRDQDDGESYGRKPFDNKEYNDSISQMTDPRSKDRKKPSQRNLRNMGSGDSIPSVDSEDRRRSNSKDRRRSSKRGPSMEAQPSSRKSVPNTERALEDLEPLSAEPPPQRMSRRRPKDERRNTRSALAGLEPISLRKYNSIPKEKEPPPRIRAALADMEPLSVPVTLSHNIDDPMYDDLESGSRASSSLRRSQASLLRKVTVQQADLENESMYDEEKGNDEEIIEEEFAEDAEYDEDGIEVSEHTDREDDEEGARGHREIRDPSQMEKPIESSIWNRRSYVYCLILFLFLGGVGAGVWALLEYVIWEEEPLPSLTGEPTPVPTAPTPGSVPTRVPTPLLFPLPTEVPGRPPPGPPTTPAPTLPLREKLVQIFSPLLPDGDQSLVDPTSPQSKSLDWLMGNSKLWSYDLEKAKTRFALGVFYYSTDGDNWSDNRRWMSDFDECTWYAADFVSPCVDRRFSRLVLGDNNVQGTLPGELALLSDSLTRFDVGGMISGQIPSAYGALTRLESLRLHGNNILGEIPASFRELTSLTRLELKANSLTGTIPSQMLRSLTNLEVLDLERNGLSGRLSSEIANLQKLTDLSLSENDLRGDIPFEIGNLKDLEILKLDDNRFSSLPRNIGLLSNLQILSIRNNMMGGTLHSALGTLRSLKALYLNHNSFTSTIPIEFGGLTNLVDGLDLSSNSLSGQVPSELGRLTGLSKLFDDIITVVLWYRSSVLYCIAIHSIDQPCCWPYLLPSLQRIYF